MTQARGSQTEEKNEANKMFIYRAFCLRDYKKVQNKRYDSQLTGDKIFKHWLESGSSIRFNSVSSFAFVHK